ncbi:unnamed protein product [Urochloa decumbens]|uniref:Uncharacterized protein n=1 Tax=Urochloa decumbens TaxID=240449 RepID=A0ABC9B571_9POAL
MEWRSSWAGRRGWLLVSRQPVIPNVEGTCAIQAVADALQARFKIADMRDGKIVSYALPYCDQFASEMLERRILGTYGADISDVLDEVMYVGIPVDRVDLRFPNIHQGMDQHRKIAGYRIMPVNGEHEVAERLLCDEIKMNGPVIGELVLARDFLSSNGHTYGPSINNPKMMVTRGDGTIVCHAVAITGYGWRPSGQRFLEFQNNWGIEPHIGGIGTMLFSALRRVFIPIVD